MATATYKNKATGETYCLGFDIAKGNTALGMAWDLCGFVSRRMGWRLADIKVLKAERCKQNASL